MKNFSIILAMLFLAFTVEAQNNERETRSTTTTVNKSAEKTPATQAVRSSSTTSTTRTTTPPTPTTPTEVKKNTETRTSTTPPSRTSTSTTTRPTETRSSGTATPPTRTSTGTTTRTTETRSSGTATPPTRTSTGTTTRTTETRSSGTVAPPTRSSNGTVTRPAETRSSRTATPPTRTSTTTRTRTTGTNASRSDGSRTVNNNRSRSNTNTYAPRTAVRDAQTRKVYTTPHTNRVIRTAPTVHYTYQSVDYRRTHYPYNEPYVTAIYWNSNMYHSYRTWYPEFNLWYYPYGYRIHTISAYDAYNYIGEIARIYGRVSEVWYSAETREYYLYFGAPYPYQDFSVIIDYSDARRFSRNPVRYFTDRQLTVTGLVSLFEDKPEIQVRKHSQISVY